MTPRLYIPRDAGALAVGADEVAAALQVAAMARGARRSRSSAPARAALLAGAPGRGRDAGGPHRLWPDGAVPRPTACSAALLGDGAHRNRSAGRRKYPSSRARPASPSRALRHRRSARRSTTTGPMAASQGLEKAIAIGPARDCRGGHAVRPARARRRGLSDRHQVEDRRRHRGGPQKYIVCNADEGDSGTFADRMLMEGDPFCLIEGMAIAGLATGATKGYRLYPLRISACHRGDGGGDRRGAARRRARRRGSGFGPRLRHGGARRRRRLCLRRGDLAARKPGGQARPGSRQAAAARS